MTVCCAVAIPEPEAEAVVGDTTALLARENLPEVAPLLPGLKVTVTGTLAPPAIVNGSLMPLRVNSGFEVVAAEMYT